MVRRVGFVLVWVLATMVATGVGLAAVRSVAGQVVDLPASELLTLPVPPTSLSSDPFAEAAPGADELPPIVIGEAESFAATSTTEVPVLSPPDTVVEPDPEPSPTPPPATTTPPVNSSDRGDSAGSPPTTQPPPPPPPTTTSPPEASETTYQLVGGWVRLEYQDGIVRLDGAGPASGFTMLINANGPDRVNIVFRGGNHLSRLRAEWRDADLEVDVIEDSQGR